MSLNNLRIFFSLICMIFVYYILSQNSSFSELILNIQQINLNYLFLLVVINILSICLIFVRFNFLIQFTDIKFLQKVYIVLNANLFNALPFPGLAEANKIYDVKKKLESRMEFC